MLLVVLALALRAWSAGTEAKARVIDMIDAFVVGAKYAISVGAAAATVGIIVGIVTLTGVGFKISFIVTSFASELGGMTLSLREREFVQYEATCFDPEGNKVFFTRRAHALDFLTRDVPKEATGIDSGAGGRIAAPGASS